MCEHCNHIERKTKVIRYKDLTGLQFGDLTVLEHIGSDNGNALWLCQCVCGEKVIKRAYSLKEGTLHKCSHNKYKEYIGQKFGYWTVIAIAGTKQRKTFFTCQCECGEIRDVPFNALKSGQSMSCGRCSHIKDLTGQQFHSWTVLKKMPPTKKGKSRWLCRCKCGTERVIKAKDLTSGHSKSCGCSRIEDLSGRVFGKLTVIKLDHKNKRMTYWLCRCECGNEIVRTRSSLVSSKSNMCPECSGSFFNMIGKKFNKLTVICREANSPTGQARWRCKCECGNETIVSTSDLRKNRIKSCGCTMRSIHKGMKIGKLTTIAPTDLRGHDGSIIWDCLCECGNHRLVSSNILKFSPFVSCGCDKFRSEGEKEIFHYLTENKIQFSQEYVLSDLITPNGGHPRIDFAIPIDNQKFAFIEYQGSQHYYENKKNPEFGKQQREITDPMKREYCAKHNIPLYEIKYNENTIQRLKAILVEIDTLKDNIQVA